MAETTERGATMLQWAPLVAPGAREDFEREAAAQDAEMRALRVALEGLLGLHDSGCPCGDQSIDCRAAVAARAALARGAAAAPEGRAS